MKFTPLTRAQFQAIPEPMLERRRQEWARIVTQLGRAHHTRYHAQLEVNLIEWANTRSAA